MCKDTDKKAHQRLVAEAQLVHDGTSFLSRVVADDIIRSSDDPRRTTGIDDVDFGCEHLPPQSDYSTGVHLDAICTSPSGNRILLVSDTEEYRMLMDHRTTVADFELGVGEEGDVPTAYCDRGETGCTSDPVSSVGLRTAKSYDVEVGGASVAADRERFGDGSSPVTISALRCSDYDAAQKATDYNNWSSVLADVVQKDVEDNVAVSTEVAAAAAAAAAKSDGGRAERGFVLTDAQRSLCVDQISKMCGSATEFNIGVPSEDVVEDCGERIIDQSVIESPTPDCQNIILEGLVNRQDGASEDGDVGELANGVRDLSGGDDRSVHQVAGDVAGPVIDPTSAGVSSGPDSAGLGIPACAVRGCFDSRKGSRSR